MPYIEKWRRDDLTAGLRGPQTPGELNFLIMALVQKYVVFGGESYTTFNSVIGALECAKQELYRRVIGPYEDVKICENGDVFGERHGRPCCE